MGQSHGHWRSPDDAYYRPCCPGSAQAVYRSRKQPSKASPPKAIAPVRKKPSSGMRTLRIATALAASLVLVVSLVDPLRGSERLGAQDATQEQGYAP